MDRAVLIGRLNGVMLTLFDSWEAEDDEAVKGEFVRARETVNDAITTLEADRTEIARLSKIEERAKDVAGLPAGTGEYSPTRLRSETAQYILEGDLHTQTTKGDT